LEIEHGAGGGVRGEDSFLNDTIQYTKDTTRNGQPLSKDPFVQSLMVDNMIESNVLRLIELRNYSMFNNAEVVTYHGSQGSFMRKDFGMKEADRVLAALGPYAVTDDKKWGPLNRRVEVHQRESISALHPGGTYDVQKLIMARRLGISRTQERAATTQQAVKK
jgi:alkylation response protein AidB-like acyl-CoA dehydrogenase